MSDHNDIRDLEAESRESYKKVQIARGNGREHITDFIDALFKDFIELKGDRLHKEDPSILGGIASFHGRPVTVIGHRKGSTAAENERFKHGMASPEGYRKSLRLMKQAEKFGRPVISFVDTPGAYPGVAAENNGQANAIAENLAAMSVLKTPVISIVTGEGGSGGALALAVADRVYMLENAVYSILSPEGFASILWKDSRRAAEASRLMRMTAQELLEDRLVDGVIPEGKKMFKEIDRILKADLERLCAVDPETLADHRYRKFRRIDRKYAPGERDAGD